MRTRGLAVVVFGIPRRSTSSMGIVRAGGIGRGGIDAATTSRYPPSESRFRRMVVLKCSGSGGSSSSSWWELGGYDAR